MRLKKITQFILLAGAVHLILTYALNAESVNTGQQSPFALGISLISAIAFVFYAAVVEFLARIADVLEGVAHASPEE